MMDRVKVHQSLTNMLRNRRNQEHMMQILYESQKSVPWLSNIISELNNPETKNLFYVALKRGFQPYSMISLKIVNGVNEYKTSILNRIKGDVSFKQYLSNLRFSSPTNEKVAIYEKVGKRNIVNPKRLESFKKIVSDFLKTPEGDVFAERKFDKLKIDEKQRFIKFVLNSLNIPFDDDVIGRIVNKKRDLNIILKSFLNIEEHGTKLIAVEKRGEEIKTFEELLANKRKGSENINEEGILKKEITNVLSILNSY